MVIPLERNNEGPELLIGVSSVEDGGGDYVPAPSTSNASIIYTVVVEIA